MHKEIHKYKDIKSKILETIERVSEPVVGTLTPKGSNVIINNQGQIMVTNDGVTIAKQIYLKDEVENTIAGLLLHSAIKTNLEAGDGTTTSILLSREFVKEGFKLLDSGWNPIMLKKSLDKAGERLSKKLKELSTKVETDKELNFIARVSANDEKIATDTVKAVIAAGENGLVLINENHETETEVKIDDGFLLKEGMFSPYFRTKSGRFSAEYKNVHVLITDKRIYYPEEAIAILKTLKDKGISNIVIVARDFIEGALNVFITNQSKRTMNILLVKDTSAMETNTDTLEDLASYLNTEVVSDKKGALTNAITVGSFGVAEKVVSDMEQTLFLKQKTKATETRITAIEKEIEKAKDKLVIKKLKDRLARMTSGTVTIFVGGKTPIEMQEKMFRFEDAVNATRASKKEGYVVGGGLTMYNAFLSADWSKCDPDIVNLFKNVCRAPLEQIAKNCNVHLPTLLEAVDKGLENHIGYNANTDKFENLKKAGIIEPLLVVQQAFENALSVSNVILSSKFIITQEEDEKDDKKNDK